jgi:hypothetical protein
VSFIEYREDAADDHGSHFSATDHLAAYFFYDDGHATI